jgi:hypothetical protein
MMFLPRRKAANGRLSEGHANPDVPPFRVHSRNSRALSSHATGASERLQDEPAVDNEGHKEAEHGAHDDGGDLAVFHVHPYEHEALDRQDCGGQNGELRMPWQSGGKDQADHANELQDAESRPGISRQGTKGRDILAYLVEHEDLHDARRCVEKRGEDLQDPQEDVHRGRFAGKQILCQSAYRMGFLLRKAFGAIKRRGRFE